MASETLFWEAICEEMDRAAEDGHYSNYGGATAHVAHLQQDHRVKAFLRTRSEGAEPTGEPCGPDHDPGGSPERYWCGCVRHARWERCPAHVCYDHDAEPPRQNEGAEPVDFSETMLMHQGAQAILDPTSHAMRPSIEELAEWVVRLTTPEGAEPETEDDERFDATGEDDGREDFQGAHAVRVSTAEADVPGVRGRRGPSRGSSGPVGLHEVSGQRSHVEAASAEVVRPTVGETEDAALDEIAEILRQECGCSLLHLVREDLRPDRCRVCRAAESFRRLRSAAGPSKEERFRERWDAVKHIIPPEFSRCCDEAFRVVAINPTYIKLSYCHGCQAGGQRIAYEDIRDWDTDPEPTPAERESGTEEEPPDDDVSEWDRSILVRLRDIRDLISDGAQDEYRHTFIEHRRGFCVVCGNARPHPVHDPGPKWITGEGSE